MSLFFDEYIENIDESQINNDQCMIMLFNVNKNCKESRYNSKSPD
jgi:hypothetical protein